MRFFLYAIGIVILSFACVLFTVWSTNEQLERTYYVTRNSINLRENPNTNSEVLGSLEFRDSIEVLDTVEGSYVSGSNQWFEISIGGERAYVHTSLLSNSRPPIPPTAIPVIPTTPPRQWDCSGDIYNCSSFSSCSEMFSYWNTYPGDPSGLDGNDNDGRPCESRCG